MQASREDTLFKKVEEETGCLIYVDVQRYGKYLGNQKHQAVTDLKDFNVEYENISFDGIKVYGEAPRLTGRIDATSSPHRIKALKLENLPAGLDLTITGKVTRAASKNSQEDDATRMGSQMMNPGSALGTVSRESGGEFKVLVYGNSIALHGPKFDIGWSNCWGMAASSADKDFAHLIVSDLERRLGKRCDFRIRNISVLERNFATNIASVAEIASDVAWKPDYFVLAVGENAPNIKATNKAAFSQFFIDIARPFVQSGAKVVLRSPFWKNEAKAKCIAEAAASAGAVFVDAGHLGTMGENMALGLFNHKGVANHPGDLGMRRLADLILTGFEK